MLQSDREKKGSGGKKRNWGKRGLLFSFHDLRNNSILVFSILLMETMKWESGGELLAAMAFRRQRQLESSAQRRVSSEKDEQIICTNVGESRVHGSRWRWDERCGSS